MDVEEPIYIKILEAINIYLIILLFIKSLLNLTKNKFNSSFILSFLNNNI